MTAAPEPDAPLWRRLCARRRNRVLAVVVVLVVAIRVALPGIVRRVVVAEADQAMVGRIEIDDVDLALLTGGFTLHGFRVFPRPAVSSEGGAAAAPTAETPATAGDGPPGSAPVFSAKRLMVDFGFLATLRKVVEVQRVELEDVAVSLDRAKDGALVLPGAAPGGAPAAEHGGPGWGVLIQSVGLRGGRIGFRDFAVSEPAQHVEVALPTLDADHLALLITKGGVAPGKVTLDAGIRDGTLHLEVVLSRDAGGPTYESHAVLANVPIADARLYIPKAGWSELRGRLDADLVHRFESHGAHTVRGTLGLRELDIRVPDLEEQALAWRTLAVDVAGIDFVTQHADVTRVALDGARIVTRPGSAAPLPVLYGLTAPAAPGSASPPPATTGTSPAVAADGARPWTWTIAKTLVTDADVRALGGDAPLDVRVAGEAGPLASSAAGQTPIHLTLAPTSGGTIDLTGDLGLTPLAFDGKLGITDLALAPLTQPVATATTRLLKGGVADVDLALAAGATPNAPVDGVRISGTMALADLEVAGDDPGAFGVRWKRLAVALRSLTAAGVLGARDATTPRAIDVALGDVTLTEPQLTVTRTPEGIALPAALRASPAPPAPPSAAPNAAPPRAPAATTETAAPPTLQVRTDRLAIAKMRLAISDTTVKPFYRTTFDPIDLGAVDVQWPGPRAKDVKLVVKSADGALLTLTGNVAPEASRLKGVLTGLPLAPFNPYAGGTGYSVGAGTARLESTIELGRGTYDTKNHLVLHQLDVRGGEGDTLFATEFGMPISLALSLLTDLQGNIVIDLPVAGDATKMRSGFGTTIANALVRAILNAVTSPLKLVGAVAHIGDKPASLAPQPIAFLAGRTVFAKGEEAKLGPLASLLAKAPALRLHLRGEAGEEDRRWLREQALRAKLEKESGVLGTLRHLGERGARTAVLAALTSRAAGTPADVPAEHREWFEQQVAAQSVDDAALRQLAAARATSVRATLASGQGVGPERVVVDDPLAGGPAARSMVAVGLGGPAPGSAGDGKG